MLQRVVELARACGEDAEEHMWPRIARIERDGDVKFLYTFFASATRSFEPAKRRVISGNVVERAQTLRPFVLRARERFSGRAVELCDAERRQRFSRADADESGAVG
ncbi:MAG TPA: hypothetical protein VGQ16_18265, partial [Vicinamibacterales bacterium]|nr:hypothetical protein [Vicinamibacterales bacterium]